MKMNAKEKNPKSSPARAGEREALRARFRNFRQLSERTRLWAEARDRQAAQLSRLQALPISPGRQAAVTAAKEALAALSLPAGEAEYEREKAVLTAAITRLSGTDQTLALSIFLLGKNYVAAGLAAGYSEDGVKKRIPKLLDRLAKEIEEAERNKKRTGNMNNL